MAPLPSHSLHRNPKWLLVRRSEIAQRVQDAINQKGHSRLALYVASGLASSRSL